MNAFDLDMLGELADAFAELEHDDNVRCGVVFAHGDHFTAGLDLGNVAPAIAEGKLALGAGAIDPWAVAREGAHQAGGDRGAWALGSDARHRAHPRARRLRGGGRTPASGRSRSKRGIFPFGGATYRLVATAGWGNAMRWLLTGDDFGADEALRLGLVQEVVEPGRQLERAVAIAERIAAQAPLGVRATIEERRASRSSRRRRRGRSWISCACFDGE